MIRTLTLIAILIFIGCQGQAAINSDSTKDGRIYPDIQIDKKILESATKILLTFGQQDFIRQKPFKMNIGYGEANCLLFEIPELRNDSLTLEFKSLVYKSQIFYPIFIKLNDKYEVQEVIMGNLEIEGSELYGMYDESIINIDKTTRYILITTDTALVSKSMTHVYETQSSTAIYTGSTPIFIPVSSIASKEIIMSDTPRLLVWVPFAKNRKIFKRENGIYWGLGASFGGEKVADNPNGDNYRAGGGAIITLGYTHSILSSNFVGRYGAGFRYQGNKDGDARNLGYLSEVILTYQTRYVNLGIGGQIDMGNSTRDMEGNIFKFETAAGPKFVLEGRYEGILSVGLEYILMNFSTTENRDYKGNRLGVAVKFFLGK